MLLLVSSAVAGCGFRLAGTTPLPASLASIQLDTENFENHQRDELVRRLRQAGADVTLEPAADRARLGVRLLAPRDQRLVTSASSGKTVDRLSRGLEYSLWGADGQLRDGPHQLGVARDITLDDDNLLSSSAERQSVIEELESRLYDRLLRQLQSLQ